MGNIFPNSMEKLRDDSNADSVDVIMRTKDRPVLLSRALQSVINQKHNRWHIYLINDGGDPQPVKKLVEAFMSRLAGQITVIHNEKSVGMAAAANMGLNRGTADFIAVHDDDDSWDPEYLRKGTSFLTLAENRRYGGFLTKWHGIEETFDGQKVEILGGVVKGFDTSIVDIVDVLRKPEIPPIALLWRRSVCKYVGYLNEELPVLDDWDLNLRILQIADIAICPEVLANHHVRRQDSNSTAYSNSVTQGLATHHRYNTMYRNSMLRASLSQNPQQIGLIATLVRNTEMARRNLSDFAVASHQAMAADHAQFNERLKGLESELKDIKDLIHKIYTIVENDLST